jgi:NDP-sugar pyrophosphorylase family protein
VVARLHDEVAGVVLAAGAGTRLAPLTALRPKALCPVGNRPLVDLALDRLASSGLEPEAVAVNLHHGADAIGAILPPAIHRSFESPDALGTAGALGLLRPWFDGRDVLVTNADAWLPADVDMAGFVSRWDRERVRLLCTVDAKRGDFGDRRYCGVALMPAHLVGRLGPEPSGLYEVCWRAEAAAGRLDLVDHLGRFVDCGTPADYLAANLLATGGGPSIEPGARIHAGAVVERTVVWSDAEVASGEVLRDAIRAGDLTILVR